MSFLELKYLLPLKQIRIKQFHSDMMESNKEKNDSVYDRFKIWTGNVWSGNVLHAWQLN